MLHEAKRTDRAGMDETARETDEERSTREIEAVHGVKIGQFTLRDIFFLMTGVAAVAAIAVWRGVATVPHSVGMLLAGFNAAGKTEFAQQPETRRLFIGFGWLLLVVSLFLPVAKGCNGKVIRGWETAKLAAGAEAEMAVKLVRREDEFKRPTLETLVGAIHLTAINAGNLAIAVLPLGIWLFGRRRGRWFGNVLAFGAVNVWLLFWAEKDFGPMSGYVAWVAAFMIGLMAFRLRWWMFGVMAVWSAVVIAMQLSD